MGGMERSARPRWATIAIAALCLAATAPLDAEGNRPTLDNQAPQANAGGGFARILSLRKPAMGGADVKILQKRLIALGYAEVGDADGYFGAKTAAALMRFQRYNGLFPTGSLGARTQALLFSPDCVGGKGLADYRGAAQFATPDFYLGAWFAPRGWTDAGKGFFLQDSLAAWRLYGRLDRGQPLLERAWPGSIVGGDPLDSSPGADLDEFQSQPPPPDFAFAAATAWDPLPRPVRTAPAADFPGLAALRDLAARHGCALDAGNLTQAVRADLDGDGAEEWVVAAAKGTNPGMDRKAGDFTLVAVYRPQSKGLELVAATWHAEDSTGFSGNAVDEEIVGLFDADGDGGLEILTGYQAYEASGCELHARAGGQWKTVLDAGFGV